MIGTGGDIYQKQSKQLRLATWPALVGLAGRRMIRFDANNDESYVHWQGFSHQVLEKFGASTANMTIGGREGNRGWVGRGITGASRLLLTPTGTLRTS